LAQQIQKFYVYSLADPRDLSVFYIGKGVAARNYAHTHKIDLRDHEQSPKAKRIREILAAGHQVKADILQRFFNEEEAYEFERQIIKMIPDLLNAVEGGGGDRSDKKKKCSKGAACKKGKNKSPDQAVTVVTDHAAKLTPKQEKFCELYLECGSLSDAYRGAYDCSKMKPASINTKASELFKNGKITSRLAELTEPARARAQVTRDSLTVEYTENRDLAMQTAQPAAANGATTGKARLHGLDQPAPDTVVNIQTNVTFSDLELARRMANIIENGAEEIVGST
jgi:hypothetical protein